MKAASGDRAPRVEHRTLPLWRLRLSADLPRYVLISVSIFGLLASARFAIDPPAARTTAAASSRSPGPDLAEQSYAVTFARRYLAWSASEPLASTQGLAPFIGAALNPSAGLVLPAAGAESVQWAEAVQVREASPGVSVYTVAAETEPEGLRYLTVSVTRNASGALTLAGYPAFVGAPTSAPARLGGRSEPVNDAQLTIVVRRALSNYLAGSAGELAADLAPGARVSTPAIPMRLLSVLRQSWVPGGGSLVVELQAGDGSGARYLLAYELDVTRQQGRWEITAIQMDPDD